MSQKAARTIYAEELLKLKHGMPMWSPEPTMLEDGTTYEVQIGDVGFIRPDDGGFHGLFNTRHPRDHEWNRNRLPGNHEYDTIELNNAFSVQNPQFLDPGTYISDGISAKRVAFGGNIDLSTLAGGMPLDVGPDISFDFSSMRRNAAMLALKPYGAMSRSIELETIKRYCIKNGQSWYDLAKTLGCGSHCGDIVFVYGMIKTKTWAMAAFTEKEVRNGATISLSAAAVVGIHASLYKAWRNSPSIEHRSGPPDRESPQDDVVENVRGDEPVNDAITRQECNQSVFLRYYQFKARGWFGPKVIKAAAGQPAHDHDDSSSQDEEDMTVEVDMVPFTEPVHSALDVLLEYLLEAQPEAEAAVACHDDLWTLSRKLKVVNDEHLASCLSVAAPWTTIEDGVAVFRYMQEPSEETEKAGGPFRQAVALFEVGALEQLFEAGGDISSSDALEAFLWLVSSRHELAEAMAAVFLDKGADANGPCPIGDRASPLQRAARSARIGMVQLLLDHGADIEAVGGNYGTPLQEAVKFNNIEVVVTLLVRGADPNAVAGVYGTPLQEALQLKSQNSFQLTADQGLNVAVKTENTDMVADSRSSDLVSRLLEYGACDTLVTAQLHCQEVHQGPALGIDRNVVSVRRHGQHGLRVEAGEIHGVNPGTEFVVYSHDSYFSGENSYMGTLVADQVYAVWCTARPKDPAENIPPDTYASVSYWCNLDNPYIVAFLAPPANDTRQRMVMDKFNRIEQGDHSEIDVHMERDDTTEEANVYVYIDQDEMVLERRHPLIIKYCTVDWTWKRRGDEQEWDVLQSIARFDMHLNRQNHDHPLQNDIRMSLFRLDSYSKPTGSNYISGGVANLLLDPHAQYAAVIQNSSNMDLWCSLHYFDPSEYSITDLYVPPSSTMQPPLRRHSDLTLGDGRTVASPFSFTLKEHETRDTGFLKLFISNQYADLSMSMEDLTMPDTTPGRILPQGNGRWDTILTIINVSQP